MSDDEKQRRRRIRYQLIIAIAALDGAPERDVGEWLCDLAAAMIFGLSLPPLESLQVVAEASGDAAFLKSVEAADDEPLEGWPPVE